MKVKDLIEELQKCNPEAEIGYEHLYIDYVSHESEHYVELGGMSFQQYSLWVDAKKHLPEDFGVAPNTLVVLYVKSLKNYTYIICKAKNIQYYLENDPYWCTFRNFNSDDKVVNIPFISDYGKLDRL